MTRLNETSDSPVVGRGHTMPERWRMALLREWGCPLLSMLLASSALVVQAVVDHHQGVKAGAGLAPEAIFLSAFGAGMAIAWSAAGRTRRQGWKGETVALLTIALAAAELCQVSFN